MKDMIIDKLKDGSNGFDVAIEDYFTLSSSQKEALLYWAKQYKYRKPKNANGSTGRYFFEMLKRHQKIVNTLRRYHRDHIIAC